MLKVIVAVALVLAFLGPTVAAFAGEREGDGVDRGLFLAAESTQSEPATVGTVAGTETPYGGPYFEQRLENAGQ
jgi:hypothetical protein